MAKHRRKNYSKQRRRNHSKKSNKYIYALSVSLIVLAAVGYGVYYIIQNKDQIFSGSSNSNNNQNQSLTGYGYVRSPYGAKFKIIDSDKSFVMVASHFDSPGVSSSTNSLNEVETKSSISNQGSQEVKEASNTVSMLNEFKTYFSSENIIFFADTNIRKGNQDKAFGTLPNSGYSMLFKDTDTYSTSLSSTANTFANPYDKLIYSFNNNDLSISNSSYDDIKSVVKPSYESKTGFAINTYLTLPSTNFTNGQGWVDYSDKFYSNNSDAVYNYVKYLISDHIPVGTDIIYKNNSSADSTIRVGGWNTLNFNLYNKEIPSNFDVKNPTNTNTETKRIVHEINVAKIISKAKYDLIGLIEINKNTIQESVNYFLKYLNSVDSNNNSYKALLSDNTPAVKQDSGQIEQVIYLYNSKKIELDNSITPKFYNSYSTNTLNAFDIFINSLNINYLTNKKI